MIDAVVYTSETGYTRKYANMLAECIKVPFYTLKEAKQKIQNGADIVYLGWIMAGNVKGYKKASKLYSVRILCAVGVSDNASQTEGIRKKYNLTDIPVFSVQGGFNIEKLHGIYKFMMKTVIKTSGKALSDKKDKTDEEKDMLDLMINGGSRVDIKKLEPVIEIIKKI